MFLSNGAKVNRRPRRIVRPNTIFNEEGRLAEVSNLTFGCMSRTPSGEKIETSILGYGDDKVPHGESKGLTAFPSREALLRYALQ